MQVQQNLGLDRQRHCKVGGCLLLSDAGPPKVSHKILMSSSAHVLWRLVCSQIRIPQFLMILQSQFFCRPQNELMGRWWILSPRDAKGLSLLVVDLHSSHLRLCSDTLVQTFSPLGADWDSFPGLRKQKRGRVSVNVLYNAVKIIYILH